MTDDYFQEGHQRGFIIIDIPGAGSEGSSQAWECAYCGELIQGYDCIFPFHSHNCPEKSGLPQEVRVELLGGRTSRWNPGSTLPSTEKVRFFLKTEWDRPEAWMTVQRISIPSGIYNPWRKCHTEHYWVWYFKEARYGHRGTGGTSTTQPSTQPAGPPSSHSLQVLDTSHSDPDNRAQVSNPSSGSDSD